MGRRRRRSRMKVPVVIALFAAAALGLWYQRREPAVVPDPSAASIRIATWNLKHFTDRRGLDLRTIARVIQSSEFDVVAIQEVMGDGRKVDALLVELGPPWRAATLSPIAGNGERFAFIYRGDRLRTLDRPRFIDSADVAVFARRPYACDFQAGQFDFTLVTLHLSYNDTMRRRREFQTLAQLAPALLNRSREKDIILLGDFNEQRAWPNLHHLTTAGWQTLVHDPTNLGSREIYDHVLINPKYTREFNGRSGVIAFDETLFDNRDRDASQAVSDHRPAYADFSTLGPDDD